MGTRALDVLAKIKEAYPTLAPLTNIGNRRDLIEITKISAMLEGIAERGVPANLLGDFLAQKAMLKGAMRAWENNNWRHHLNGEELMELIRLLEQFPTQVDVVKPLVFISCGQYSPNEIALGKALEEVVRSCTHYDAYFAEQQNSLEGLVENIFSSLHRCAAFVGVMHHRGIVRRPSGEIVRGSVWIEQELAIAAFIQNVLRQPIEVAMYFQKGIHREGIREQLRLGPVEFESDAEVVNDFRQRVATWKVVVPSWLSREQQP